MCVGEDDMSDMFGVVPPLLMVRGGELSEMV